MSNLTLDFLILSPHLPTHHFSLTWLSNIGISTETSRPKIYSSKCSLMTTMSQFRARTPDYYSHKLKPIRTLISNNWLSHQEPGSPLQSITSCGIFAQRFKMASLSLGAWSSPIRNWELQNLAVWVSEGLFLTISFCLLISDKTYWSLNIDFCEQQQSPAYLPFPEIAYSESFEHEWGQLLE